MILLPKAIYGFNALPTKAPCYSSEKQKNNFKIYTDVQKTLDRQGYYTKGIIIAYLTSYYRAVVMKNMVLVQKQTHMSIEHLDAQIYVHKIIATPFFFLRKMPKTYSIEKTESSANC